jgi:hypothetical protein
MRASGDLHCIISCSIDGFMILELYKLEAVSKPESVRDSFVDRDQSFALVG